MTARVYLDPDSLREASRALRDPFHLRPVERIRLAEDLDRVARASEAGLEPVVSAGVEV